MKKWGYGLTIFGILGFICTMTNKETRDIQTCLTSLFFIFLGILLLIISKKNDIHINTNIHNKAKARDIKEKSYNEEGIIYPIHIKYKKIEVEVKKYQSEKLNFLRDMWYNQATVNQNQPTYNCILDGKIVATLSCGQEADIEPTLGEHVLYFETINQLLRKQIENK